MANTDTMMGTIESIADSPVDAAIDYYRQHPTGVVATAWNAGLGLTGPVGWGLGLGARALDAYNNANRENAELDGRNINAVRPNGERQKAG